MAFSARAPRSHCAWKPENAEQHLSVPQCQVSVGKKRWSRPRMPVWSTEFWNERRHPEHSGSSCLLARHLYDKRLYLCWKHTRPWNIHPCENVIFKTEAGHVTSVLFRTFTVFLQSRVQCWNCINPSHLEWKRAVHYLVNRWCVKHTGLVRGEARWEGANSL